MIISGVRSSCDKNHWYHYCFTYSACYIVLHFSLLLFSLLFLLLLLWVVCSGGGLYPRWCFRFWDLLFLSCLHSFGEAGRSTFYIFPQQLGKFSPVLWKSGVYTAEPNHHPRIKSSLSGVNPNSEPVRMSLMSFVLWANTREDCIWFVWCVIINVIHDQCTVCHSVLAENPRRTSVNRFMRYCDQSAS